MVGLSLWLMVSAIVHRWMGFTWVKPHGNPWLFLQVKNRGYLNRLPVILNHAKYLIEHKGDRVGTREIRKHLLAYVKSV